LLPEEPSLFFERLERFAPTAPDFFVEDVRLEAAAVRLFVPEPFPELLLEEDFARLEDERDDVPPVERPLDFLPDDFDLVPDDLVADFVPDFAAERPLDFVPDDFARVDLVPADLPPEDLLPEDFEPDDLVREDRELEALLPADFVLDFAPELFVPVDLDRADELFVPLDLELLRADVPLLFRAVVEDLDEPLRERLPLPLEDELPPEFSLLVFDLSSVGICRLLLGPSRDNRHACKATSIFVLGSKQRPVSQVETHAVLGPTSLRNVL
jgi:hypothetical protein